MKDKSIVIKRKPRGPKIVAIGGGTGLSVFLSGLKKITDNITAIVTVADNGGGSGILREDLGMLPPGDIRACILALANTQPNMEKLFQFRFSAGINKGQSVGNLLIAAMNEIHGSFEKAIQEVSNVLAITGKVLPMTLENVTLYAELTDGCTIKGESEISLLNKENCARIKRVYMEPRISYPLPDAIQAIKDADIIVLGPGSLYTSIIPNLLVEDMVDTIINSKAMKIYICNLMTQIGETTGYTVLDHLDAIIDHSHKNIIDYIFVNNEEVAKETLDKYIVDGQQPIYLNDKEREILNKKNIIIIEDKFIDIKKDYIRHDAYGTSEAIYDLYQRTSPTKII